jgi:signal transduction histidine kinase
VRSWRLRVLVPLAAVGLVAAVAAGVFAVAWSHAERSARDQAVARAERIAARAAETIALRGAEIERSARLLADTPDLARRIADGDPSRAQLDRFRTAAGLDGVAASVADQWIVVGAIDAPADREPGWRLRRTAEGWRLLAVERPPGSPVSFAAARSLELGQSAVERNLQLLEPAAAARMVGGGRAAALHGALEGAPRSGWDSAEGAYAIRPITTPGGALVGVLDAAVPRLEAEATLSHLAWRALAISLLVVLAAALVAAGLASRLAGDVADLSAAAEAIGGGDLEHRVPPARELDFLSDRLETMRRRLQRDQSELGRRQAEMEAVVSGIAEGVVAVDGERRVRFLSAPAAELLGVDPAQAVGMFCGDLLRPEPLDGTLPCDSACPILHARFRGPARAVESLRLAGGGQHPFVVSSAAPAPNPAGGTAGGMQVVILRHESALEAARRARDAAVADLAHELQTPLAAQGASLELLRERVAASDERALDLVLALEAGTFRLRRLIDNLLESVRIESGQLAIRRVEVDLDEVIEEAVAMTQPLLARRRQTIELDLPPVLPTVQGDPQRLAQVVVNLLSNASKYGPESSAVRLGVAVEKDGLVVWVADRGPGFSAPSRPGGRFRRGAAEPPQAGSGLGLWLCRSILERHGGELLVTRAGEETLVSARLPLGDAA